MAKLSLTELESYVNGVVTAAKLSNSSFSVTRDNVVGLVDKIGKIVTLDSVYAIDKLAEFEGEFLSFGKTVEEYHQDLIMPQNYDSTGAGALTPNDPTYRPNFYSYTLGRKVIKTTLRNDDIERAVHFVEQFVEITSLQVKRVQDSMAAYRYQVKREMLGKFIGLVAHAYNADSDIATFATATAYNEGTILKDNNTPTAFGIVVKKIPASPAIADWATAVSGGYIIVYSLLTELAVPSDDTTGEAFIQSLKEIAEKADDLSEGNSLNGNTLGAVEGLTLFVKQGIMPVLDVKTLAGAFHLEKVGMPARVIVLRDFGNASSDYWAVLMDSRAMKLHRTYAATRENMNGDGDFLNIFSHTEDTAWISRNAFIHVWKKPA